MAVLTQDEQYPCAFVLRLSEWERYTTDKRGVDVKTVGLGDPYTLWVEYSMALRVGDRVLYESEKDTTLILEDIRWLIND